MKLFSEKFFIIGNFSQKLPAKKVFEDFNLFKFFHHDVKTQLVVLFNYPVVSNLQYPVKAEAYFNKNYYITENHHWNF